MPKRQALDLKAIAAAALPQPDPVREATAGPARANAPALREAPAPTLRKAPAPEPAQPAPAPAQPLSTSTRAASRRGRVQITGWFSAATRKRLKLMALEEETSVEALLGEAIEDLFTKRSSIELAERG